jgi:hypothetical protein
MLAPAETAPRPRPLCPQLLPRDFTPWHKQFTVLLRRSLMEVWRKRTATYTLMIQVRERLWIRQIDARGLGSQDVFTHRVADRARAGRVSRPARLRPDAVETRCPRPRSQTLIIAVLIGTVFLQIGTDQRSAVRRQPVLFFTVINQARQCAQQQHVVPRALSATDGAGHGWRRCRQRRAPALTRPALALSSALHPRVCSAR